MVPTRSKHDKSAIGADETWDPLGQHGRTQNQQWLTTALSAWTCQLTHNAPAETPGATGCDEVADTCGADS